MAKSTIEKVKDLLKKADEIREKYKESKELAIKEVDELTASYKELEEHKKATHKLYVLNQVTSDSYTDIKKELETLEEVLNDTKEKVSLINSYKNEELKVIYNQIDHKALRLGKAEYHDCLRKRVLEAKEVYLKVISDIAIEYKESRKPLKEYNDLKEELGIHMYSRSFESADIQDVFVNTYLGDGPAVVDSKQIVMAYNKK